MAVVGRARMGEHRCLLHDRRGLCGLGHAIPAIQQRLDLAAGELGLAILGLEVGALVGLSATRWLVREPSRPTGSASSVQAGRCSSSG
jgi:hypothetical protein